MKLKRPKERIQIRTNALRSHQSQLVCSATRRFESHPKSSKRSLLPSTVILHKVGLRPTPHPAKKSLNLHKISQHHHRRRNKANTTAPGCELRLEADSQTANDSREPSKHLRPLRTKGPISCPQSIKLLSHRREIQQFQTQDLAPKSGRRLPPKKLNRTPEERASKELRGKLETF